jgi:hypothetical protein
MRLRAQRSETAHELPGMSEYVPGLGVVPKLDNTRRWLLAGEYAATHRLTGPRYRRTCRTCGTRGRCEYGRWSDDILIERARREWLGR